MVMQNANLKNSFSKNNYKENPNVKMSDKDEHLEVYHSIQTLFDMFLM